MSSCRTDELTNIINKKIELRDAMVKALQDPRCQIALDAIHRSIFLVNAEIESFQALASRW